jgi:hypothetical protein
LNTARSTGERRIRLVWVLAGFLLTIHAVLAWIARAPGILTANDDAFYVLLGRSLRELQYREVFEVDAAIHSMYPPAYPALLAIWSAIGGEGFDWLILINIGSSVLALGLVFSSVHRLCGSRVALATLAALTPNPVLIEAAGSLLSEAPFMLFQSAALWAFTREEGPSSYSVVAGGSAVVAALTRSVGMTLAIAVGLYWLRQRRYRDVATYAAVFTLTVGLWTGWTVVSSQQSAGPSYVADALARPADSDLTRVIRDRILNKAPYLSTTYWLLPVPTVEGTAIDNVLGMPIVFLSLIVGLLVFFRSWPAAAAYLTLYGMVLLVWPYVQSRFLVPLLPLLVAMCLVGMERLLGVVQPSWRAVGVVAIAGVLVINGTTTVYATARSLSGCHDAGLMPPSHCVTDDQASFFRSLDYVRQHVPREAVFFAAKPATFYYYTGRRTVSTREALSQKPSEFFEHLRSQGATHVLLSAVMPMYRSLPALVREGCGHWQLEQSFPPSTFLFQVLPTAIRDGSSSSCDAAETFFDKHAIKR